MSAEKNSEKQSKGDGKDKIELEGQEVVKGPRLLPEVDDAEDE